MLRKIVNQSKYFAKFVNQSQCCANSVTNHNALKFNSANFTTCANDMHPCTCEKKQKKLAYMHYHADDIQRKTKPSQAPHQPPPNYAARSLTNITQA